MAEEQLRDPLGEFAHFLRGLTEALDEAEGWYGVFLQRDPAGVRACLEGREVPPWDVVESLLHDLSGRCGTQAAAEAGACARQLHGAAVAAYDALTGPAELRDRLDATLGELREATRREHALRADLEHAEPGTEADALTYELAWAADDMARAHARVQELQLRIEGNEWAEGPPLVVGHLAPHEPAELVAEPAADSVTDPVADSVAAKAVAEWAFADARDDARDGDRENARDGDRERGQERKSAKERAGEARGSGTGQVPPPPLLPHAQQAVTTAVTHLAELRAAGRGGEAHAVLCAAARRPAEELPFIADELERCGLAADVPTLLWEVACLPPVPLAAAAGALAAAGRGKDCASLLRQGVARPVAEVASAAQALLDGGCRDGARDLLAALVRTRTAQEAAGLADATDVPEILLPLLLEAAEEGAPNRYRDLVHALRMAGVPDRLTGAH
ncbi:hypothetical protein [Streptomyces purpurogeneiscleroticus]|uniref:hypothetical protein n=1 Tax=Streptomyces purpurogeneiscleroticus TaxID=68259 RepID=UPI001CC1485D|nr:hypothetical protein [Streptomyces purpurogeneiscleroticus]MBZ4020056.1 hypothetical protein [Streptomyces purpurogeneiscleroticus]